MQSSVTRRYSFEAGHWLPLVPEGHKCARQHGHNYDIEVTVAGEVDRIGFVIDFWDLDKIVEPLIAKVDHRMLNDIEGLSNPTAEYIASWFFEHIRNAWSASSCVLQKVRVYETKDCYAEVGSWANGRATVLVEQD
jgi:6-pyruvoyltetrahydropterin/6-carboxytetrahydropterin synthase